MVEYKSSRNSNYSSERNPEILKTAIQHIDTYAEQYFEDARNNRRKLYTKWQTIGELSYE